MQLYPVNKTKQQKPNPELAADISFLLEVENEVFSMSGCD